MHLGQCLLAQIQGLGELDVVELGELVAQHRVEFRQPAFGLDHVLIAHALAPHQLHRQPQQRGGDAFIGGFLEVVPAQESHYQTQVGKAVFGAVAPGVGDQAVQRGGQVGLVFKAQPLLQRDGLAGHHIGSKRPAPAADLLGADALDLQHQRHAGHGEIHRRRTGPVVEQAVAPRQIK